MDDSGRRLVARKDPDGGRRWYVVDELNSMHYLRKDLTVKKGVQDTAGENDGWWPNLSAAKQAIADYHKSPGPGGLKVSSPDLNLDVQQERTRALHRVVRAMHDGHCPSCGHLAPAEQFDERDLYQHRCPRCAFTITDEEATAALYEFLPTIQKSVVVFEAWRKDFHQKRGHGL